MTSERKRKANRKNAKKAGIRTAAGKAVSRLNAVTHGLLSKELLINHPRYKEEKPIFDRLSEQFLADLQPVGAIENALVTQIISYYWRLRRVARAERAVIEQSLTEDELARKLKLVEHVLPYDPTAPERFYRKTFRMSAVYEEMFVLVKLIMNIFESDGLPFNKDIKFMLETRFNFGHSLPQIEGILFANYRVERWQAEEGRCDDPDLSPGERFVRELQAKNRAREGEEKGIEPKDERSYEQKVQEQVKVVRELFSDMEKLICRRHTEWLSLEMQSEAEQVEARTIPTEKEAEKIQRYETHLHRLFFQNLHELQRVQAARLGRPAPQSAALDVTLNSGFSP